MNHKIEGPSAALRTIGPVPVRASGAGGAAEARAVEATAASDRLRLTGEAEGLHALQSELAQAQAIDPARVRAVREALQSGAYRVDAEAIAGRMLEIEDGLRG